MNKAQIVPSILIALNVISAIVYLCHGDVRKTIYWLSAAVLTTCVTF